jgi:hypothetical protein
MAHLLRFDSDFSRRSFLELTKQGLLRAGVFGSAWSTFLRTGSVEAAYPEELLSIDAYTRGRLKVGDVIDASNVEVVKELLDPIRFRQISTMGRKLRLGPTTTDLTRLNPLPYLEATAANRGKARFDSTGNIVTTDGKPWIGGNPFPDPTSALEVFAAHTLSWGRHDVSVYASKEYDLDAAGNVQYQYSSVWSEMATVARTVLDPKPYWHGETGKLRYQSVLFTDPADARGTSYLNIWPYDQNQFPQLYGYLPAFKRVRNFPTNQRFEPLVSGAELYLSDAWAAGDPFLTWGNYRVVHRGPHLAAVDGGWSSERPNWEHRTHGGPNGNLFWDHVVQLVPEVIVIEAEPVRYPRAPVARKHVWFDARTLVPFQMVSFDRRSEPFRHFDAAFSTYEDSDGRVMDGTQPYWSWTTAHAFNVQTRRMTRIEQVREVAGGHTMRVNDPSVYEKYLTLSAMHRMGG